MSIWFEELILQDADFLQINSKFPILLQIYKLNVRLKHKNKRQERQTGGKGRREREREEGADEQTRDQKCPRKT